jgi:hypothetical protein
MGLTKRLLEEREDLRTTAVGILCDVGALKECEFHDGIYFEGDGDLEGAYRLANSRISKGELELPDDMTRRNFTDEIKKAYEELSLTEACWACERATRD